MTWHKAGHESIETRDMLCFFNAFTFFKLDNLGGFWRRRRVGPGKENWGGCSGAVAYTGNISCGKGRV
jgi:hypothetical protein